MKKKMIMAAALMALLAANCLFAGGKSQQENSNTMSSKAVISYGTGQAPAEIRINGNTTGRTIAPGETRELDVAEGRVTIEVVSRTNDKASLEFNAAENITRINFDTVSRPVQSNVIVTHADGKKRADVSVYINGVHEHTLTGLGDSVNIPVDEGTNIIEIRSRKYSDSIRFTADSSDTWVNFDISKVLRRITRLEISRQTKKAAYIITGLAIAGTEPLPERVAAQPSSAAPGPAGEQGDIAVFPQLGHSDWLTSVMFSPDGRRIVSASYDGTVKLWDVETGRVIHTLQGHTEWVWSAVFSPDGQRIASASSDDTVKLWDAETGKEIRTFQGHSDDIHSAAFSPDGRRIVSASDDETVKVWDVETGKEIRTFSGHTGMIYSAAYSPDGRRIISASDDETVKVWDVDTGKEIRTFSGHTGMIYSVAYSPDGRRIISASDDKTVKVWDAQSGREIHTLQGHSDSVHSVAYNPDGRYIVSVSLDETVKVWDVDTGREIRTFSNDIRGVIFISAAYSPDGRRIVLALSDDTVKVWDAETGREIRTLSGHTDGVNFAAYSPDGRRIVCASSDKTVKMWDAGTGREIRTLSGHSGTVRSAVFSPNGRRIVSAGRDETVKVWDTETGREIRTLSGHSGTVRSAVYSPDGRRIVSASDDDTVKVWDAETGRELFTFSDHNDDVTSVAFSPDGHSIVSASYWGVKVWDTETGRGIRTLLDDTGFPETGVNSTTYSPDGRYIVSASQYGTVKVWNAESGREIRTFQGHADWVWFAAFSPNGRRIVSASVDRMVKVWDVESGRELLTLSGHTDGIRFAAYSPDGRRIVSASNDGTTRLWDAETGKEIVQFVSFTGSDTQIASATRGLTVETEAASSSIDGEWLAITQDGYYQASPQGDRYINVRVGNTVTGIDAFRSVFYNPDVVQARLQGRPDPASKGTVTIQQLASFLPPTVTIRSPVSNTTTTSASATLSVSITDQNQPIQNIKIMVNGRLLGQQELSAVTGTGLQPQKASYTVTGNQKAVDFQLPLNLDPGPNRIEVVAFNGFSESRRYTDLTWNAPAGQRPALPNLWILAIGVNSYADNNIRNLNYCVADAKSVVDSLKAQEGKRYGKVNSLLIADGERLAPTAANIRQNLGFLEGAGPRDVVLLFLAGHGVSENAGAFFFLPGDARLNADNTVNPATAIAGADLFSVLDAPGNRLVFIDACQSGGVDNDRLVRYLMDTNAFVFASSRGNELSQERSEFGHGVFTYSILNAIKGATAARAEGNVSVLSLSGFVSTDVPKITDDRQHPSAYSLGFYDFPLAVIP